LAPNNPCVVLRSIGILWIHFSKLMDGLKYFILPIPNCFKKMFNLIAKLKTVYKNIF